MNDDDGLLTAMEPLLTEEKVVEHERVMLAFREKRLSEIAALPPEEQTKALEELQRFLDPHDLRKRGS